MAINYGEGILIEDSDGGHLKGTIVDVWRDASKKITDYIVQFDSGVTVRIKPNYRYCREANDFVFALK